MKIAVNTRLLLKDRLDGIGRFSVEVLSRMVKSHPEHDFYFLFDRPFDESFVFASNVHPVVLGPQARHPFLFVLWFEFSVYRWLNRNQPDLFLSPDGYLSLRTPITSLAVIHDLNFEHFPEDLPWLVRKYYRTFFPRFAKKASRLATVSNFSANDIVQQYGVVRSKIDLVYNGVNEAFSPADEGDIANLKELYTKNCDYFITVGSIHPRKNVVRTIKAFTWYRRKFPNHDIKLLLVGDSYWWSREMKMALDGSEFRDDIVLAGRLDDVSLNIAISGAVALIYISYFEGFGIPMIEAMRCGTPVIAARATALPEVAKKAAFYVDPFSVEDISYGMLRLVTEPDLQQQLIEEGFKQASFYTWDSAAKALWDSIEKTIEEKHVITTF